MTYDGKELTVQDSAPVMLVQFLQGLTTYQYTTIAESIVKSSVTWDPRPIEIGNMAVTGDVPKDSLTIRMPITVPIAATFVGYTPDVITTVTVFRTHYDDSEVRTVFKGRVTSTSTSSDGIMTLTCEPVFTSIKRLGPRQFYQRTCRFALGRRGCNVDMSGFDYVLPCTAVAGNVVTVTGASAIAMVGGTLKAADGTIRNVIAQSANVLTLSRKIKSLTLSALPVNVTLYVGCNRTLAECHTKFNNAGRWGGAFIPRVNPMSNLYIMGVLRK